MDVWGSVTALALWDTLNFPVMLMLIFVLGRPHPVAHGLAFSIGMLGTHFLGGLIFSHQAATGLADGLRAIAPLVPYLLFALGIALVAMGTLMRGVPPRPSPARGDHTTAGWVAIGIALTMTKLPIAAAYALAVTQITEAAPNEAWVIIGLGYYNVVAFLPFLAIWIAFFAWRASSQKFLGEINLLIRDNAARLVKWAMIGVGILLIGNFALENLR